ncbi:AAA family ATPase [Bacillus toyonensis]|uniref:AAA family ATPase n=1 Tax=Bacillus toyonensis TaxID=155322 RepID=UPI00159672E5|nr:AAA family ATPase [Bacillus toyonensis]
MKFYVVNKPWEIGTYVHEYPCVELLADNWNDYGYETTFTLHYFKKKGIRKDFGMVKILNDESNYTRKMIPSTFEQLDSTYCSLGQSTSYYRELSQLSEEEYKAILNGIQDIAFNRDIYEKFPNKEGIQESLFRSSEANKLFKSAYDKYFLNTEVDSEVFNFQFRYNAPYSPIENTINFNFEKSSFLPNRMNILVGKNGAGKTQLLSSFADALCGQLKKAEELFEPPVIPLFSKVIAVSFSAFDDFRKPYKKIESLEDTDNEYFDDFDTESEENKIEKLSKKRKLNNYVYCGIQDDTGKTLSLKELKQHGQKNLLKIKDREANSKNNIKYLEKWKDILLNIEIPSKYLDDPYEIFNSNLSSGQSILVSIITEVIANIEDESILLFDEPELHLHPNAVSNLVRMLYHLLEEFNSYAIISTHSPIIIQEIPSFYINKLERTEEDLLLISKITIETFGENISAIVNEVFNVREVESNYKSLLKNAISSGKTFEEITEVFPNGLSLHAMTYLNILFNQKNRG